MALQAAQLAMLTLAVLDALHVREAGFLQRQSQRALVVEKLVSPSAERTIESKAGLDLFGVVHRGAIVRDPDPVEVRRRQAQHTVIAQDAAALAKEIGRLLIGQML